MGAIVRHPRTRDDVGRPFRLGEDQSPSAAAGEIGCRQWTDERQRQHIGATTLASCLVWYPSRKVPFRHAVCLLRSSRCVLRYVRLPRAAGGDSFHAIGRASIDHPEQWTGGKDLS